MGGTRGSRQRGQGRRQRDTGEPGHMRTRQGLTDRSSPCTRCMNMYARIYTEVAGRDEGGAGGGSGPPDRAMHPLNGTTSEGSGQRRTGARSPRSSHGISPCTRRIYAYACVYRDEVGRVGGAGRVAPWFLRGTTPERSGQAGTNARSSGTSGCFYLCTLRMYTDSYNKKPAPPPGSSAIQGAGRCRGWGG